MGEIAHVGAAVFFGHGHAEYAEFAEFAPQVHRKLVVAVDLGGSRGDLGGSELLQRVAQHGDVVAEVELKAWQVEHVGVPVLGPARSPA